jgi:hypothetical protein
MIKQHLSLTKKSMAEKVDALKDIKEGDGRAHHRCIGRGICTADA